MELADEYNVTVGYVIGLCCQYQVKRQQKSPRKILPSDKPAIVNLYLSQVAVKEIADQYGVTENRIYGIVREQKVRRKMKPRVERKPTPVKTIETPLVFPEFPSIITEDIGCYRHGIYPLGSIGTFSSKGGLEQRGLKQNKTPKR